MKKKPDGGAAGLEKIGPQAAFLSSTPQNASRYFDAPRRRQQPERVLTGDAIELIGWRAPHVWVTHFPSGGKRSRITGAILKKMGTRAGVPDLLLICEGRIFGIELKNGTRGRLSDAQIATHSAMRRAGAIIGVAGTLGEVNDLLSEWGITR
jgi:hypothetical protein